MTSFTPHKIFSFRRPRCSRRHSLRDLSLLLLTLTCRLAAGPADELLLDVQGQENPRGFPLQRWNKYIGSGCGAEEYRRMEQRHQSPFIFSYDVARFQKNARKLLLWEFRKNLKKEVFSLGFQQPISCVGNESENCRYFIMFPATDDRELAELLFLRRFGPYSGPQRISQTLLAIGDYGRELLQPLTEGGRYHSGLPVNLKYLDSDNAAITAKRATPEEIRRRNYKAQLSQLKNKGFLFPFDTSLLQYYPAATVVNDLLAKTSLTLPEIHFLWLYASLVPAIDDATARKLLPYLTAAT
ncbi:MAG: hypothetical protein PHQ27_06310, partial [Victivallales bacterium]|nr:hypothetical protein [Victivallales bacterium]